MGFDTRGIDVAKDVHGMEFCVCETDRRGARGPHLEHRKAVGITGQLGLEAVHVYVAAWLDRHTGRNESQKLLDRLGDEELLAEHHEVRHAPISKVEPCRHAHRAAEMGEGSPPPFENRTETGSSPPCRWMARV